MQEIVFINNLVDIDVILASGSPRRKQLLEDAGITFRVLTKNTEENFPVYLQRAEIPLYLSKIKAQAVKAESPESLIIAADTVVIQRRDVLNKPANKEEAKEMLQKLSNNMHEVITGVTICYKDQERSFYDITEVFFKPLSEEYIEYYIEKYSPFDKAGGYGIQEWLGMVGIRKINGDFYNVMGLPVAKLIDELEKLFNPNLDQSQNNPPEGPSKYLYFGI